MKPNLLTTVKNKASKLATFIGEKHKIRIKTSTALEAIARMENFPDWNTFAATLKQMESECPLPPFALVPSANAQQRIPAHTWIRHIQALGSASVRQAWLGWQLGTHILEARQGLFVNVLPPDAQSCLADAVHPLDLSLSTQALVAQCLSSNKPLVVWTSSKEEEEKLGEVLELFLVEKLQATVSSSPVFTLCLADASSPALSLLLALARAAHIGILTAGEVLSEDIAANTWTTLYLEPTSKAAMDVFMKRAAQSAAMVATPQTAYLVT